MAENMTKHGKGNEIKCSDRKFSLLKIKSISSSHEHMTKRYQIRDKYFEFFCTLKSIITWMVAIGFYY